MKNMFFITQYVLVRPESASWVLFHTPGSRLPFPSP